MNDADFQKWSETLSELRQSRQDGVAAKLQEMGRGYDVHEFFDFCVQSLESILSQWFEFEQASLDGANLATAVPSLRKEVDSILDFELEAISKDVANAKAQTHWDEGPFTEAEAAFQASSSELRKKYQMKVDGLGGGAGGGRRRMADLIAPSGGGGGGYDAPSPQMSYSRGGGSSGMGMIMMFIVGLMLGGGPSVYFWNNAQEADQRREEERSKWQAEQRSLQSSIAVLNESFVQLATGKMKSLAELDREIARVHAEFDGKRQEISRDFQRQRDRMSRRNPSDRLLSSLDQEKNTRIEDMNSKEAARVEPLTKQRALLTELLGKENR